MLRAFPIAIIAALSPFASAGVVRPAPPFTFGAAGKSTLSSLRGQPVVLVAAASGRTRALRAQMKNLATSYHECASRGTIFIAAISDGSAAPSDIPFALANHSGAVAAAYGMRDDFLIAVIGRDGNLDLVSDKPISGSRVFEVIKNNFDVQEKARRVPPRGPSAR